MLLLLCYWSGQPRRCLPFSFQRLYARMVAAVAGVVVVGWMMFGEEVEGALAADVDGPVPVGFDLLA